MWTTFRTNQFTRGARIIKKKLGFEGNFNVAGACSCIVFLALPQLGYREARGGHVQFAS